MNKNLEAALHAHSDLAVFSAVMVMLEGGTIHGDDHGASASIIAICKKETIRQLRMMDAAVAALNKATKPAPSKDTARLNDLRKMGGFVRGTSEGEPAYRILTRESWHPTLRMAIDEVAVKTTKKNLKPNEEQS